LYPRSTPNNRPKSPEALSRDQISIALLPRRSPEAAAAKSWTEADLLDHFVGAEHQAGGHLMADGLCSLEIDHKLELGGLLDREIGGLGAT